MGFFNSKGVLEDHAIKCGDCGRELGIELYNVDINDQRVRISVTCKHCGTTSEIRYGKPTNEIITHYAGTQCVDCKSCSVNTHWSTYGNSNAPSKLFACANCGCEWEERYTLIETVMHTKGHEQ